MAKAQEDMIFRQPYQPLEVIFECDTSSAGLLAAALEDVALSVSQQQQKVGAVCLQLIVDGNQRDEFERRLDNLTRHYDLPPPSIGPLVMQDWVRLVQQHFKPLEAGRFYIHGSHIATPPPLGKQAIQLDAGAAFGTGEHETTKGCLMALDRLLKARQYRRILDMGCGSGILAIAAAKASAAAVVASDNDPVSVAVARENLRVNQRASQVQLALGDGYHALSDTKGYDLILSNILARPLMRMAVQLRRHLLPGGDAVLSGLLGSQVPMVLWAHRQAGLSLVRTDRIGPWAVLHLRG